MSVVKCTREQRNATGRKVFAPFKGIRIRNPGNQEPGEVKSGIRNPLKNDPESSNWNLQIMTWNPESKTVLDSLTCDECFVKVTVNRSVHLRECPLGELPQTTVLASEVPRASTESNICLWV